MIIKKKQLKVKIRIVSVDADLVPVNGKNTSIFIMASDFDPN